MIPIPASIPAWALKGGVILGVLAFAYGLGCRTQKSIDLSTIQRAKDNYERCVGIVDTFQDNVDVLEKAVHDQNEAIINQGEEYNQKVIELQASHERATRRLITSNRNDLERSEEETRRLRERMVNLSVGESCIEALKAISE